MQICTERIKLTSCPVSATDCVQIVQSRLKHNGNDVSRQRQKTATGPLLSSSADCTVVLIASLWPISVFVLLVPGHLRTRYSRGRGPDQPRHQVSPAESEVVGVLLCRA